MRTVFIFMSIAAISYSTGMLLEVAAEGAESKILRLLNTGQVEQNWIPFGPVGQMYQSMGVIGSATLENYNYPQLIEVGQMSEDQSPISVANVAFNIGVIEFDNNGKKSLQNVVDRCIFHSQESFFPLCVVCKLYDSTGTVLLGEGAVLELVGYSGSDTVEINISPVPEQSPGIPASNDVQNVERVRVEICTPGGDGCTPGYWKQSQHFGSWTAPYMPEDPGATVFGDVFTTPGSLKIKVDKTQIVLEDATLLQALNAQGGAVNALARHAAAALLNAASTASYAFTVGEVITTVNAALASGDDTIIENTKNTLAGENEKGCPFGLNPGESAEEEPVEQLAEEPPDEGAKPPKEKKK
jgi:hypothetical protein